MRVVMFLLAFVGSLIGGLFLLEALIGSNGAPQQAAFQPKQPAGRSVDRGAAHSR